MNKYIIGRSPNCDIIIDDPTVSRNHAEIIFNNDDTIITDLKSANGTFVNGLKIQASCHLKQYDILKVGNALVPWRNYLTNPLPKYQEVQITTYETHTASAEIQKIPGIGDWIVIYLLMLIPLINIILLIIWANDNNNKVRKNWSIAALIWLTISIGLTIMLYSVIISALISTARNLL